MTSRWLPVIASSFSFETQRVDRLFEAFYTDKGDGMGIGLSVSRSIIESHHGRLWAVPNAGAGATFAFSIPRGPEGVPGGPDLDVMRIPAATSPQHLMGNA